MIRKRRSECSADLLSAVWPPLIGSRWTHSRPPLSARQPRTDAELEV
jgi:hypothetical protein